VLAAALQQQHLAFRAAAAEEMKTHDVEFSYTCSIGSQEQSCKSIAESACLQGCSAQPQAYAHSCSFHHMGVVYQCSVHVKLTTWHWW
jgi:hypothetical protein